ncbi:hypothetical protein ACMD2_06314 [Ananas comosus]|uniref:Zinc-ribbon 15 domain-containing protein n=1 Tax=Ananas comosus TaxID=4615 RepID=A0A199W093_ANACO|nr:hypothetical protein ACMD2_06314 [Ananas comosus]
MFFFFVGGLEQSVGRVLKEGAGRCVRCGAVADLVETEKVLKLFFVPVWRWPSEAPAYYCRACDLVSPLSLPLFPSADHGGAGELLGREPRCRACDRGVDPQFRFCPFCGNAL